jgi:multiple sugar transport system substrate-binding protein
LANNKYLEDTKKIYKDMVNSQPFNRENGDAQCKTMLEANTEESYAKLPKDITFVALKECNRIDNNAAFSVEPHKFITVEGDDRNTVFTKLLASAFDGDNSGFDEAISDLNTRYNDALKKALEKGVITQNDLQPKGFDYFNR